MKTVPTFTAQVWVGLKERESGEIVDIQKAKDWLQSFVDTVGFCVSFTPTEFIYKNGGEPGFVVGIINYPRFPEECVSLRTKALYIAEELRVICKQLKVTAVFPDETVMVGSDG